MNSTTIFPVLPLRDVVVYPQVIVPLFVGRKSSIAALDYALNDQQELLLIPQKNPRTLEPTIDDLHEIATVGKIVQMAKLSDGKVKVLVEGLYRAKVKDLKVDDNFFSATAINLTEKPAEHSAELEAMMKNAISAFDNYLKENSKNSDELIDNLKLLQDAGQLTDTIAAHIDVKSEQRVNLLGLLNVKERLEQLLIILEQEQEKTELERIIKKRVKQQMERNQREYYLNEQMKAIQKELGDMDGAQSETEILEQNILDANMSTEAQKKALSELNKLRQMSSMAAEATVIRNYLEWLINFPWAKHKKTQYDLTKAQKVLDQDHYGLTDVKDRILDYLAVQKRTKNNKAPIICLVGPPGVGKTSLGKSIARATGRDFERISLGGVKDEAEIRGHRRTYIGAMPGKIVQKLCKVGSNNPVLLLDEIDKMSMDYRGDPASALLEVLDPNQNHAFSDHYLEQDVDLSKVLFIATANTLNIPTPLLDRMEIIEVSGYTENEKREIAKQHIIPKQQKEHQLKDEEFQFEDGVIEKIIDNYTREAGVRGLERQINKLARKTVRAILENSPETINLDNLTKFLGVEKYLRNEEDLLPKVGVINGLAWTAVGGELMTIEAEIFHGKGKLNNTGKLGDVMKESIQAALSVVRKYLDQIDGAFKFNDYDIHLHVPEGAVPKDGPSAGIGIATVLLSALTGRKIRGDIAMTGELTLQGRVLAIGGLKEKLLSAKRSKMKTVLIPKDNLKDLHDVADEIKNGMEIIAVSKIKEVFAHAFADKEPTFKALHLDKNVLKNPVATV